MSKITALLTLALATAGVAAAPSRLPPNTPLIVDGPVVVDSSDFEGNMLRIPPERRDEFRTSYERVANIVDQVFIARTFATRARELGLDRDPAVQKRLQQVQDGVLADLYMQHVESKLSVGSLEARARELYKVEQAKLVRPEEVYIQHILVNLSGRTRSMALDRAKEVAEAARAGEDFLVLAGRYSDDPDKRRNSGDLGYNAPAKFVEPVRNAIAAMKTKGEIAGPVESEFGFHVIRFVDRKPAQPIPYEEVKKKIIAAEEERIKKQRLETLVNDVRGSKTVVVHRDNVQKLVIPVDLEALNRAAQEASAAK